VLFFIIPPAAGLKQFDGSIVIRIDQSPFMLLDFRAKAMPVGRWGRENQGLGCLTE